MLKYYQFYVQKVEIIKIVYPFIIFFIHHSHIYLYMYIIYDICLCMFSRDYIQISFYDEAKRFPWTSHSLNIMPKYLDWSYSHSRRIVSYTKESNELRSYCGRVDECNVQPTQAFRKCPYQKDHLRIPNPLSLLHVRDDARRSRLLGGTFAACFRAVRHF